MGIYLWINLLDNLNSFRYDDLVNMKTCRNNWLILENKAIIIGLIIDRKRFV